MKYLIILTLFVQLIQAAPAFHGKRTFTQPDGTKVTYRLQGDEHLHWMESDDGKIMLFDKRNERLEYAEIKDNTLRASGVPVSDNSTAKVRSAAAKSVAPLTKEALSELYKERRAQHLSKMKPRHSVR